MTEKAKYFNCKIDDESLWRDLNLLMVIGKYSKQFILQVGIEMLLNSEHYKKQLELINIHSDEVKENANN